MEQLLGQMHFELVYLYGHREEVLGRYETVEEGIAEQLKRVDEFGWLGGKYILRRKDY